MFLLAGAQQWPRGVWAELLVVYDQLKGDGEGEKEETEFRGWCGTGWKLVGSPCPR